MYNFYLTVGVRRYARPGSSGSMQRNRRRGCTWGGGGPKSGVLSIIVDRVGAHFSVGNIPGAGVGGSSG